MVKRTSKSGAKGKPKASPSSNPKPAPASNKGWSLESIKTLINFINERKIQKFDLELGDMKLHIVSQYNKGKKVGKAQAGGLSPMLSIMPQMIPGISPATPITQNPAHVETEQKNSTSPHLLETQPPPVEKKEEKYIDIKSPMVGTFYRAPSPESPPYVEVGDNVTPETVLCIIEAMKLMNEIKAEVRGQIIEILAENSQPVEYGQPMFKIKPL